MAHVTVEFDGNILLDRTTAGLCEFLQMLESSLPRDYVAELTQVTQGCTVFSVQAHNGDKWTGKLTLQAAAEIEAAILDSVFVDDAIVHVTHRTFPN